MNIEGMKGEFFYRALVRVGGEDGVGFYLTNVYYSSREEVEKDYKVGVDIKWPVDEVDRGVIYIPAPEEFQ